LTGPQRCAIVRHMTETDQLVWMIGRIGATLAPTLKELARFGPAMEQALWPKGAPAAITWEQVTAQVVARLRVRGEAKIRREIKRAKRKRGGGGFADRAVAAKIVEMESLMTRAEADQPSVLDEVLFAREPPKAPLELITLIASTAGYIMGLSDAIERGGPDRTKAARILAAMLWDFVLMLRALMSEIGEHEEAARLKALAPDLEAFRGDIEAAALGSAS
jgi:hypothetical protein